MAQLINQQTLEYPVSDQEFRIRHPEKMFPAVITDYETYGYAVVFDAPPPACDPITQYTHQITPHFVGGHWEQNWEILSYSAAEIAARQVAALQQIQVAVTNTVQARLDAFARTRMYDDIKSLSDYAGDADPVFAAEGNYGKAVRSQTWRALITYMTAVEAGTTPPPASVEAAIAAANLPVLAWP